MRQRPNIRSLPFLMVITILGITAFQLYWLDKAYEREQRAVEKQTNILFAETVFSLQSAKLKLDRIFDTVRPSHLLVLGDSTGKTRHRLVNQKMISMMNVITQKIKDSSTTLIIRQQAPGNMTDTIRFNKSLPLKRDRLVQFMFDVDSLQDSIRLHELDTAYANRLVKEGLNIPFHISRVPTKEREERVYNEVTLGFRNPITYRLDLGNMSAFLLKRIAMPVLFTFFLLAFTILSFSLLYRNLLRQRRLGDIKNEFISNITHELKTPIATVSVAIEALRSFNASMDPMRTKEYLDISANELQRLSLLVDKVLKLSMFEKKEIDLRYEPLDMKQLVDEVTNSMRLQFEKQHATVNSSFEGNTMLEGDRLHLVSVIFNLLDNALKYSIDAPQIGINVKESGEHILLCVSDKGVGIPAEYQPRIFEKFFRVPTGNLHNAKGYGLGLSYVAHVVAQHHGKIIVESSEGIGSTFKLELPKKQIGVKIR